MTITFEDERRWLAALAQISGPFFLIGFEDSEQIYLLERARDRLKMLGHHLDTDSKIDASRPSSLMHLQSTGLGLFDQQSWQIIDQIDAVKKDSVNDWVQAISQSPLKTLVLSSKKLAPSWQSLLTSSAVLDVSGEKPWDKPKRLSAWLQALVKSLGMEIAPAQAASLCEQLRCDRQMIKTQVEALAAFHGYKGTMQISHLSVEANPQIWKWIEFVFAGNSNQASDLLDALLIEDPSAISIAALLRQQWHSALAFVDKAASSEVNSSSAKRQYQLAVTLGFERLRQGALYISKAQAELKSSREPREVLQMLTIRLSELVRIKTGRVG